VVHALVAVVLRVDVVVFDVAGDARRSDACVVVKQGVVVAVAVDVAEPRQPWRPYKKHRQWMLQFVPALLFASSLLSRQYVISSRMALKHMCCAVSRTP
jgi:hypothetical protein